MQYTYALNKNQGMLSGWFVHFFIISRVMKYFVVVIYNCYDLFHTHWGDLSEYDVSADTLTDLPYSIFSVFLDSVFAIKSK